MSAIPPMGAAGPIVGPWSNCDDFLAPTNFIVNDVTLYVVEFAPAVNK